MEGFQAATPAHRKIRQVVVLPRHVLQAGVAAEAHSTVGATMDAIVGAWPSFAWEKSTSALTAPKVWQVDCLKRRPLLPTIPTRKP